MSQLKCESGVGSDLSGEFTGDNELEFGDPRLVGGGFSAVLSSSSPLMDPSFFGNDNGHAIAEFGDPETVGGQFFSD